MVLSFYGYKKLQIKRNSCIFAKVFDTVTVYAGFPLKGLKGPKLAIRNFYFSLKEFQNIIYYQFWPLRK